MNVAVVVVAYNRPKALLRLLDSLSRSDFSHKTCYQLIISIDFSSNEDVYNIATEYQWEHGSKEIISYSTNLGLKQHILNCGSLTDRFDAVVVLEDDLVVSPFFFNYCLQAVKFYGSCDDIAGISLYSNRYNDCAAIPFEAIKDEFDAFFMKIPSSWGQIWTKNQWQSFITFYSTLDFDNVSFEKLPVNVQNWPSETSWKKYFYLYMCEHDKYFVYPQISLTTNFGDIGQHFDIVTNILQVPLLASGIQSYNFSELSESNNVYDEYFELESYCLENYEIHDVFRNLGIYLSDIELDLHGSKPLNKYRKDYLISLKQTDEEIISFDSNLSPPVANLIFKNFHETNHYLNYSLAQSSSFRQLPQKSFNIETTRLSPLIIEFIINKNFTEYTNRVKASLTFMYHFKALLNKVLIKCILFGKRLGAKLI